MPTLVQFNREERAIGPKHRLLNEFIPIETTWFKTVFQARKGQKLELGIFAASRYCLYVNGRMIANGPQKGDRNTSYLDRLEIGGELTDGTNVISVKVTSYPPEEAYVIRDGKTNIGPYGVLPTASGPCLLVISSGDGPDLSTTDADWRCRNDSSVEYRIDRQGFIMGGNEYVDVSKMTPHTLDDSFEDFEPCEKRWAYQPEGATSVAPFSLYERTLPQMKLGAPETFSRNMSVTEADCTPIDFLRTPVTLAAHGRYAVDMDASELRTAYLSLSMRGGKGAKIQILCTEAYSNICREGAYPHPLKGRRDDCEHYGFIGLTDQIITDGREWTYQTFWFRTFRFVRVIVETQDEPLTLSPLTYRSTGYPLDVKAKIAPKQDWIRDLWKISIHTLEMCMHETHEDCPFYEQLQYILDTRLQMLFTYALTADVRMAERVIYDFHSSLLPEGILQSRYPSTEIQVIPCFALQWIGMLSDYYRQTGSDRLIRRYRTTLESILDWFGRKRTERGLAEKLGYWEFFDWPEEWGEGYGMPSPVLREKLSASENMAYAYFLGMGADLLEVIGHTQDAEFYRKDRAELLEAIQKYFWDDARGLYREGIATKEYTQHAQFYAVLNGLVRGEAAKALMRKVLNDETLVQATFPLQFPLFRALEKTGLYEETEKRWEMWKCLLDQNLTTIPEVPGPQTRSDCHAWGALLLYEYPHRILGIYPEKPGYECIGIRPMGMYLGQAAGEIPTPKGNVSVEWEKQGERFTMRAKWPQGVPAKITLPDGETIESSSGSYTLC